MPRRRTTVPKPVKESRRRNVITLWQQGVNHCENGRKNGISESTVRYIIKRWERDARNPNAILHDKPRSGRPREYGARFTCFMKKNFKKIFL